VAIAQQTGSQSTYFYPTIRGVILRGPALPDAATPDANSPYVRAEGG
jgi:hypothetical protein